MSQIKENADHESSEVCPHLAYEAWQPTYLTESAYITLVALISFNSISAITAILLKVLVIIVIATKQQLRTLHNILLACLAGTDLPVGMLVQPLFVASEMKHILNIGPFCTLDTVFMVASYRGCTASISHLMLISVEGFVFIKFPLRYEDIVTEERITAGLLTAWAFSAVWMILMSIPASINTESELYSTTVTIGDLPATFVLLFIIAVIVYCYVTVFMEARNQRRRLRAERLPEQETLRLRKHNKATNTLTIILSALLFSYMPSVIFMGFASSSEDLMEPHVLYLMSAWSYTFVFLNSLLNPLIYCWRIKKLRRAFHNVFHSCQSQVSPERELRHQQNNIS